MAFSFTKRRFLQLSSLQQHKKCAEMLKEMYGQLLNQGNFHDAFAHYNELQMWMNAQPLSCASFETIADRYHAHLKAAKLCLQEAGFLPALRQGDKEEGQAAWQMAIYLDNLRSAHNVGSILRTVEAFRAGEVYFSPKTPFADHPQVQKTSMEAYRWVTCHQGVALKELPKPLFALDTSQEAKSLYDFPFPQAFTLVVGNEEYGCSQESLQLADAIIEIPLRGRKNSLNVANAFAVAISEIQRQKLFITQQEPFYNA